MERGSQAVNVIASHGDVPRTLVKSACTAYSISFQRAELTATVRALTQLTMSLKDLFIRFSMPG